MASRVWNGGTGDWFAVADWSTPAGGTNSYPQPGDTAVIAAGTVELFGSEAKQAGVFDANTITLGGALLATAPTLLLSNAVVGHYFAIDSTTGSGFATIDVVGASAIEGSIVANASGGRLTINVTPPSGGSGSILQLLHGSSLAVQSGDTLLLNGALLDETGVTIDGTSSFVNDGTFEINNGNIMLAAGAQLSGSGTFEPGLSSSVYFAGNTVPSSQVIDFNGADGRLRIATPSTFGGVIVNFASGDLIDLTTTVANAASYDATDHLLIVMENTTTLAAFSVQGSISGTLATTSDGAGGTYIEFAGQATRMSYEITAGDIALKSNVVRATMTTHAGTKIDGTGIKIGILSDSFNTDGLADTEAAEGYLPENANGTSAVKILKEDSSAGENEGRAMAELIHQVAPGAQIDFYTASNGQTDFANGVNALVADGCNIIVDDWAFFGEPFFQVAGPVDTAISNAIASGVDYFTSAGNFGNAYYQANWTPVTTTLTGVAGSVSAMQFSNGTPYQSLTLFGGTTTYITLQWDAAFPTNANVADSLVAVLYDANGNFLSSSTQISSASGLLEPEVQIAVTPSGTSDVGYRLAVYQKIGTPTPTLFKYVLFGSGNGTGPGGIINDPAAENGSGDVAGHALVPGVNTVGAIQWPNSTALGNTPVATEFYSDTGPGTLLFDTSGNRLTTPSAPGKVDFVAPDGIIVAAPDFSSGFYGTSAAAPDAAAVAALMLQADPMLTTTQVTQILETSAVPLADLPAATQGSGLIQATTAVQAALAACYAEGTRLRTPRGDLPIETLRPGDCVVTAAAAAAEVLWVGRRRLDLRRHPRAQDVMPVRVTAGAVADGVPSRDLVLSPDHAVFVEGALIPIRYLVNGVTIVQEEAARITYFHVELRKHDLVLAEGLPAESYLDTGNRCAFENGGPALALHPSFARAAWDAGGCAPLVLDGAPLAAARRTLLRRAEALGHALTANPMPRLIADGRVLLPSIHNEGHLFRLPDNAESVRLVSRVRVPAHVDPLSDDYRPLGIPVWALRLDRAAVPADDPRRGEGWYPAEDVWQWTDGDAALDCCGARWLEVFVARIGQYWAGTQSILAWTA